MCKFDTTGTQQSIPRSCIIHNKYYTSCTIQIDQLLYLYIMNFDDPLESAPGFSGFERCRNIQVGLYTFRKNASSSRKKIKCFYCFFNDKFEYLNINIELIIT